MRWILILLVIIAAIGGLAFWFFSKEPAAQLNTLDHAYTWGGNAQIVEQAQSFGGEDRQKLTIWQPTNLPEGAKAPVLVFFYGGSWYFGERSQYGFVARRFAELGYIVVLPDYRLYPQVRFPGMVEDSAAAIAWVHDNIAKYGGDPDRIVTAGHSAGAYNAVMTALDPQWLGKLGKDTGIIKAVAGLAGPYDFYPFTSDAARNSFGAEADPAITQPVTYARADAPPLLLATGLDDETVKPRNGRALKTAINALGGSAEIIEYADIDHAEIIMAVSAPFAGKADIVKKIDGFYKARWQK